MNSIEYVFSMVKRNYRKLKMEEWDTLLGYRQPAPSHRLIDNYDRNCMRSWPAQMSGDNAPSTSIVATEPAAGEASGASVEEEATIRPWWSQHVHHPVDCPKCSARVATESTWMPVITAETNYTGVNFKVGLT